MNTHLTLALSNPFDEIAQPDLTQVVQLAVIATGAAAGLALLVWLTVRTVRAAAQVAARPGAERRVLIVVAIVAAFGVAAIGGARSFSAVSEKFNSPLVPLVADGMIIACTALRLAALTRGWRIPGALVTTYVFIGGTVWLNVDTATGIADAVAHALAPIAYAVLVEMLAHLLRLQMKLAQPARAKLSALTWFTSPVITTRVWLHLARTGTDDPIAARALVQQVVRMSSRLTTVCPSRRLLPLDSARAARSAALQTIRDGLLTAGQLAALLPSTDRMTAGELLAVVDSAALGLPVTDNQAPPRAGFPLWLVLFLLAAHRDQIDQIDPADTSAVEVDEVVDEEQTAVTMVQQLMVGYVVGALLHQNTARTGTGQSAPAAAPLAARTGAPAPHRGVRAGAPAPVHPDTTASAAVPVHHPAAARRTGASVISAPVAESPRSGAGSGGGARSKRNDDADLAALVEVSRRDHGGRPLGQREITRVLGCGFPKARRLADRLGWTEAKDTNTTGNSRDHHGNDNVEADANSNNQHPNSSSNTQQHESSRTR
ncbi:uncharacterized protein DUF2637 [Kribbella amoyensis]|uniref:Uncharacterized protein DUF2637 n=1 Tax=Kribbella amoyensis TaxID=996641 RepID=A0A561BSB0_9ACTN|nr:DUF2637 domain-containing protein [Kribbella amoyensis]TWD81653.1 uncharacterized protein DUF2637 [Kribbella amoyensis]